jgi:hypothetical protein
MAKIYNVPKVIKVPEINFNGRFNIKKYDEEVEKFKQQLKDHLINLGYTDEHVGEIISFPVADGKAMYMVAKLKPVMLVHLPLGDAWEFEYAHLLTKTEVIKKIQQHKALEKIFSRNKK